MDPVLACIAGMNCDVGEVDILLSETKLSAKKADNEASSPEISGDDRPLEEPQAMGMAQDFAIEHRIFLRAVLALLNERDRLTIDAYANSSKTIKVGHLKKASRRMGLWRTKIVELRRGTLCYFDDADKQGSSSSHNNDRKITAVRRKDLPLTAASCTCRPVKHSGGAVFELRIQGGSRRLWMAKSPEERLIWIQAIHNAMIGASVTRGDNFLEYQVEHVDGKNRKKKGNNVPPNSPYREFLEQYLEIRAATQAADSKDQYLGALSCLRGKSITVPVQWIKSQVDDTPAASFVETEISSGIDQLWKDLLRDSVEINGEVIKGDSLNGPERVVGQLTQHILGNHVSSQLDIITEVQAISYARDILLACDRTRSGGDSYFCLENLCLNRTLVVLCPSSTEASPISVKVSTRCQQKGIEEAGITECGWAISRKNSGEPWKRQYMVLSNSVLYCYSAADPKPHELLEKVMLQGAKIDSSSHLVQKSKYIKHPDESVTGGIVNVATNDGQIIREYLFEDEFNFIIWHISMKKSADSFLGCQEGKYATSPHHNTFGTTCHTVDAIVNVCTEYKICTADPSGVESSDTWAALRTTFVQRFTLTGGPNGRIFRGDEVVHLEVL
ncbi:hypothetical protein ACHAW5_008608 [Stephanodiscus triporus]|uniref:PH domain-containing protein n=1 Tax=Stephanodiscus triporus TaxID=2934178 RepID=A0ABD3NBC2_9STRA